LNKANAKSARALASYWLTPSATGREIVRVSGSRLFGSRGQNKVIVCLLQYAAEQIDLSLTDRSCIWLLDDLPAELDLQTFDLLWDLFAGSKRQLFATRRNKNFTASRRELLSIGATFHVEQGFLTPEISQG